MGLLTFHNKVLSTKMNFLTLQKCSKGHLNFCLFKQFKWTGFTRNDLMTRLLQGRLKINQHKGHLSISLSPLDNKLQSSCIKSSVLIQQIYKEGETLTLMVQAINHATNKVVKPYQSLTKSSNNTWK